jgi:OPT oligopeptide transporter protein
MALTRVNVVPAGTLYNQLLILNDKFEVDATLLRQQGLPYYASTWVISLIAWNLGVAATITHLLLWNRDDLRRAWSWISLTSIKNMWTDFNWRFWNYGDVREPGERLEANGRELDPHYQKMLAVCLPFSHLMITWC